jgi:hypothetical protein
MHRRCGIWRDCQLASTRFGEMRTVMCLAQIAQAQDEHFRYIILRLYDTCWLVLVVLDVGLPRRRLEDMGVDVPWFDCDL